MNVPRRCLATALALAASWGAVGCSNGAADTSSAHAATPSAAAATPLGGTSAAPATGQPGRSSRPVHVAATPTLHAPSNGTGGGTGGGNPGDVTACVNPMLHVTPSLSQGAAGTMVQRFLLKNVWPAACSLQGTPTVTPYRTTGGDLTVDVGSIPNGFGDLGQTGGTIVLQPGQTAAFFLKWSDVPVDDAPCPQADGFRFRAPLDPLADGDKLVPFAFGPCGGALQVSQVLPASVTG